METNITPTVQKSKGFDWKDFLSFKTMITLKIIQIVYAVVAAIITIGGLMTMFSGGGSRGYGGYGPTSFIPGGFMGGLLIIIFGNVLWRVWCELIIVFFRINKSLNNIDDKTKG
jgi:hypothetical protein